MKGQLVPFSGSSSSETTVSIGFKPGLLNREKKLTSSMKIPKFDKATNFYTALRDPCESKSSS